MLYCGVMYELEIKNGKGKPTLFVNYQEDCPSGGYIAMNSTYGFTSYALWRDLGFIPGTFGTEIVVEIVLPHPF